MYRDARCPKFQTLSASHFTAYIWNISLPSGIKLKDNVRGFSEVVCACVCVCISTHTHMCCYKWKKKIQKGLKPSQQKNLIPSSLWVTMQYHLNLGDASVCAHLYLYGNQRSTASIFLNHSPRWFLRQTLSPKVKFKDLATPVVGKL